MIVGTAPDVYADGRTDGVEGECAYDTSINQVCKYNTAWGIDWLIRR